MNFTKEMVDEFASKLLIGLTDEENKMVLDEFTKIDDSISLVNEIDGLNDLEPMTHTLDDFSYNLREDVKEDSPSIEKLFQNCDEFIGREVEIPKVVG